jgi:esterase/lipase
MAGLEEYGLLVAGLALGTVLGWMLAKQTTSGDIIRAEERIRASEESASVNEQRIRAEVENISKRISEENTSNFMKLAQERWMLNQQDAAHALETRKQEVEHLLAPIKEELSKLQLQNTEMEK